MDKRRTDSGAIRVEVQALRAVAVLLVVFYHLWPGRMPGGYVGVDVFFVISGFLITGHLVREVASDGRIRFARFWARRARRLLPAAFLVLATSACAVFIWVPQVLWQQNFREIIGSGLYVENWLLAGDAVDYLAAENAPSVAQHYWSLSVEEQFYLFWPVLIAAACLIAARVGTSARRSVAVVLAVATGVSLAYSLWVTQANPSAAYFVTPARAWQFGAGGLLALAITGSGVSSRWWRSTLSWTGWLALAWCGFMYSNSTPFPGTAALLPVAATLGIIAAGSPSGPLSPSRLMAWRPVQWLGDVSYSMYLWHWPPIVVLPFVLGHELGFGSRVAILAFTIVAAWLTKRWVEDPIRFGHRLGIRRSSVTFAFTGVAAAALVGVSWAGWNVAAQATQRAEELTREFNADTPECFGAASFDPAQPCTNPALDDVLIPDPRAALSDFALQGCFAGNNRSALRECSFGPQDASVPHVVMIGDSHARAMSPIFTELAEQGKIRLTTHLKGSCSWSSRTLRHSDPVVVRTCGEWRANLTRWLDAHVRDIDIIVTTAAAHLQFGPRDDVVAGFVDAWKPYDAQGIDIVAIKDPPKLKDDPNLCLAELDDVKADSCSIPSDGAFRFFDALTPATQQLAHGDTIDLTRWFCNDSICPAVIGGVNVHRDKEHITSTYARTLTPYVYDDLLRLKVLQRQ